MLRVLVLASSIALATASGGHNHGAPSAPGSYEWAGTFDTPEAKYVWTAQSVDGAYVDPGMKIVFLPVADSTATTLSAEEAEGKHSMGMTCTDVNNGGSMTPQEDKCYKIVFDTNLHTNSYSIDTTGVSAIAIFAEHVPTEFERSSHYIQDVHGDDIEPVAELPVPPPPPAKGDKPWGETIGATFLVCICTLIGVVLAVPMFAKLAADHPTALCALANAFASGAILAAAFYLMLYEATHLIIMDKEAHATAWWGSMILLGFLTANILDTAVQMVVKLPAAASSDTEKGVVSGPGNPNQLRVLSGVLLGDIVHNFVDGIIIGAAFLGSACDANKAWGITAATVGHELAQELSDYLVLTDPNQGALKPVKALALNFASGLSVVLGAIVILSADVDNRAQGMLLAYGGGVYVQIGAAECMARVNQFAQTSKLRALCLLFFVLGAICIGLVLISHEHCSGDAGAPDPHAGHNHGR